MSRKINKIILHCSAEPSGRNTDIKTIQKWHLDRGFNTVGYHYFIKEDGTVQIGRSEEVIGAHCQGENSYSIGICYGGGLDENMQPLDTRNDEQNKSLFLLVNSLLKKYNLTIDNVYGHYQFANKACPSFKIEKFQNQFTDYLTSLSK